MADREQPYDPYIPTAGQNGAQGAQVQGQGGNVRTQALQAVRRHQSFRTAALPRSSVVVRRSAAARGWCWDERWRHDMLAAAASLRSRHQLPSYHRGPVSRYQALDR